MSYAQEQKINPEIFSAEDAEKLGIEAKEFKQLQNDPKALNKKCCKMLDLDHNKLENAIAAAKKGDVEKLEIFNSEAQAAIKAKVESNKDENSDEEEKELTGKFGEDYDDSHIKESFKGRQLAGDALERFMQMWYNSLTNLVRGVLEESARQVHKNHYKEQQKNKAEKAEGKEADAPEQDENNNKEVAKNQRDTTRDQFRRNCKASKAPTAPVEIARKNQQAVVRNQRAAVEPDVAAKMNIRH